MELTPESHFPLNWVDFVLLGFLLAFVVAGYRRGFLRQVLGIAGIAVAFVAAAKLTTPLANHRAFDELRESYIDAPFVLSYIAIFAASAAFASVVVQLLTRRVPEREALRPADSMLGALFGAAKGILLLGGLSIGLLQWHDIGEVMAFRESAIAPRLADGCRSLVLLIPERERIRLRGEVERVEATLQLDPPPENPRGASPGGGRRATIADPD